MASSPGGREAGRISIRVLPDTSRFATDLQKYLDRIEQRAQVKIAAIPDMTGFAQDLQTRLDSVRAGLQVDINPDTTGFAQQMQAELSRSTIRVEVPVVPVLTDVERFRAELAELTRGRTIDLDIDSDAMLRRFRQAMEEGIGSAVTGGLSGLRGVTSAVSSSPWVAAIGTAMAAGAVVTFLPAIGALLSGAVIVASGIGVIGLGAALLKNNPEVKSAAKRLTNTVKNEFTAAAQPMVKPLTDALLSFSDTAKKLKPSIDSIFSTSSGFIKPLTDGINNLTLNAVPGFAAMLQGNQPLFDQVGKSLGDIGKALGDMFKTLSASGPGATQALKDLTSILTTLIGWAGGLLLALSETYLVVRQWIDKVIDVFQHLYDVLIGHSIIPDLINGIVQWFTSLPGRIAGALAKFVSGVTSHFTTAASSALSHASSLVTGAASRIGTLPGRAASALATLGSRIGTAASSAASRMFSSLSTGVSRAVGTLKTLPSKASSALSGLGGKLFGAGASLINGFINGIISRFNAVRSTLGSLTSLLPDWKGPASKDKTLLTGNGQLVIEGFMAGIQNRVPDLKRQLNGLTTDVSAWAAPPGVALDASIASSVSGNARQQVVLNVGGSDQAFLAWLRSSVKQAGGNVQIALGQAGR